MAGIGRHPPMDKHLFDSPLAESDTVHYSLIHRPFCMPLHSGFPSSTGEVSGAFTKQLLAFWILHDPHYHVQMIDGNDWTRASPVWRSSPIINLFEWLHKTYKSHHICKNSSLLRRQDDSSSGTLGQVQGHFEGCAKPESVCQTL